MAGPKTRAKTRRPSSTKRKIVRARKTVPPPEAEQTDEALAGLVGWNHEALIEAVMRPFAASLGYGEPLKLYAVAGVLRREVDGKLPVSVTVGVVASKSPNAAIGHLQQSVQSDPRGFMLVATQVVEVELELMQQAVLGVPGPLVDSEARVGLLDA